MTEPIYQDAEGNRETQVYGKIEVRAMLENHECYNSPKYPARGEVRI